MTLMQFIEVIPFQKTIGVMSSLTIVKWDEIHVVLLPLYVSFDYRIWSKQAE